MALYIQPHIRRWNEQQRALGVNIREENDIYILSALVPGLKSDDLNIQVLENVVSIEGEYKDENAEYLLNELPSGTFRRTLRMPTDIEAEKVEAKIVDGILTLNLPKAESARPKKIKIAVN